MKLLVDTHVVLWWRAGDRRLSDATRAAIARADTAYVSAASVWEVAIKVALGRLTIPEPFTKGLAELGFVRLPVTWEHAERVAHLRGAHRDPFDRILVAQALEEGLTLVSADEALSSYEVSILRA